MKKVPGCESKSVASGALYRRNPNLVTNSSVVLERSYSPGVGARDHSERWLLTIIHEGLQRRSVAVLLEAGIAL